MSFLSLVASRLARSRAESLQAKVLFRQLQHQTKNVLQRVLGEITRDPELQSTPHGRMLVKQLEMRILLAADISDQLFDSTSAAATIAERLRVLGESTIAMLGFVDQQIALDVSVEGDCPAELHDPVVRIANEMVGNAIKHGMGAPRQGPGRIEITLTTSASGVIALAVRDNGCGPPPHAFNGQGLDLIDDLSAPYGGQFALWHYNDWTEATVTFPCAKRMAAGRGASSDGQCGPDITDNNRRPLAWGDGNPTRNSAREVRKKS